MSQSPEYHGKRTKPIKQYKELSTKGESTKRT